MSRALAANLLAFGRLLRSAGITVAPDQSRAFGDAVERLGLANRRDVKAAGRAIFVRRREEIGVYDSAFDLFFRRSAVEGSPLGSLPRIRQAERRRGDAAERVDDRTIGRLDDRTLSRSDKVRMIRAASSDERLRTADFAVGRGDT